MFLPFRTQVSLEIIHLGNRCGSSTTKTPKVNRTREDAGSGVDHDIRQVKHSECFESGCLIYLHPTNQGSVLSTDVIVPLKVLIILLGREWRTIPTDVIAACAEALRAGWCTDDFAVELA
jgi:hypothetical protein